MGPNANTVQNGTSPGKGGPLAPLTGGGQQVLGAAGNVFLHVAQGDDVLGPRQQAEDVVAVLLLGHLDLPPRELLAQRVVAEEVVVHLGGGPPAYQQGVIRALEQLQALGGNHCAGPEQGGEGKGRGSEPTANGSWLSTYYVLHATILGVGKLCEPPFWTPQKLSGWESMLTPSANTHTQPLDHIRPLVLKLAAAASLGNLLKMP